MTRELAPHQAEILSVLEKCEINDVVSIEIHPRPNNKVAWIIVHSKNARKVLSVAIDT